MRLLHSSAEWRPLILVVEDDPFIALDLQQILTQEGYSVLGPASSVSKAFHLLHQAEPDAAILDVNLQGKVVTPFAAALADEGIPFVIASGNTEPFKDDVLAQAPNLGKPTEKEALLGTLEMMLADRQETPPASRR